MRLWSLHPKYLDACGLTALWREALLAQAVLKGETRGYQHHPQLVRFREVPSPLEAISAYLQVVYAEGLRRGYHFDSKRIASAGALNYRLEVTEGQILYEWGHLRAKLAKRSPRWWVFFEGIAVPDPHPLFRVIPGPVAPWERLFEK